MTKLRRPETKNVATFLYELLVASAPSRDFAKRVAEKMNVPYPSLARYWQGKAAFPAGYVRPLFAATNFDQRVAEFFLLDGSNYRLERCSVVSEKPDLQRELMLLSQLEGEISGIYLEATQDDSEQGQRISNREARILADALRKLMTMADQLRRAVKALHS